MEYSYRELEGQALLQLLYENPDTPVAVDTETTGLKVAVGDSRCIGVSIAFVIGGKAYSHYFAFNHAVGRNCGTDTLGMLDWVLNQPRLLIFANAQFDILALATIDIFLDDADFIDICTMAHLINENQPINKGVDSLALYYLHETGKIKEFEGIEELIAVLREAGLTAAAAKRRLSLKWQKENGWPDTTPEMMYEYAAMDAISTWRVWDLLKDHPAWIELPDTIWPHKQELTRVLLAMKRRGVLIDREVASEMTQRGEAEMERLHTELGLNPASPKDQYELFIERLGLPVLKKSKITGRPSFDKTVMAQYDEILEREDRPEARIVKEFRGWQKAVSAAYRPYLALLDSDGRLRCSYKTHGTTTGRLSCSEPNLQQIPKSSDKPWNGKVKECFIARPGYTLINADFSQLELRLATAYAGEMQLKDIFIEGRDIFTEMSKQLGMSRNDTKTLVYSMQYGAGIKRIMGAFGVSKEEATRIRTNYFNTYPRFKNLADICANRALTSGKVRIWSGRYRRFEYPSSENYKAMNAVIQGGAADIVEHVMVRCFRELDNDDCQMLLQVHDSITWEVRTELVSEYMPRIEAIMEDVAGAIGSDDFDVRFAVDVGFWSEREERLYNEAMGLAA